MRTALGVQAVTPAGLDAVYTPANVDGHSFGNNGRRLLHVVNGSAGPVTVTVPTPGTVDGNAIADRAVVVVAGGDMFIGPFSGAYQQSDGSVHVDYSAAASVTVALLEV